MDELDEGPPVPVPEEEVIQINPEIAVKIPADLLTAQIDQLSNVGKPPTASPMPEP